MPELASCKILGERNVEFIEHSLRVLFTEGACFAWSLLLFSPSKELSKFDMLKYQDVISVRKT
jgi:hypothetical protein